MKLIQLTKGKQAIVDDDDYEELNQFKWYSNNGYVCRAIKINGVYKTIPLHRTVNKTPIGLETDHINRNKLDNRKSNLRSVSRSINNFNKSIYSNNNSGLKRLSWYEGAKLWQVQIYLSGKRVYYKSFKDKNDAIDNLLTVEKIYLNAEFWQTKPELVC